MNTLFKRSLLALGAGLFSLGLLEGGLRLSTSHPIDRMKQYAPDQEIGYVLNSAAEEVDRFGYRNKAQTQRGAPVVAIGDSHTYGLGVSSDAAWPQQLMKRIGQPVYNYGVPGYSPAQYEATVKRALGDGAQYVLIALLIQYEDGSDLMVPVDLLHAKRISKLFTPPVIESFTVFEESVSHLRPSASFPQAPDVPGHWTKMKGGLDHFIKQKTAIGSAYRFKLRFHLPSFSDKRYRTAGPSITYKIRIRENLHSQSSPRLKTLAHHLKHMKLLCDNHGAKVGVILLPSVGRAISLAPLSAQPVDPETPERLKAEKALVQQVTDILSSLDMPWVDAAKPMALEFASALENQNEKEVFVPWDSHPREQGHRAYVTAAEALLFGPMGFQTATR